MPLRRLSRRYAYADASEMPPPRHDADAIFAIAAPLRREFAFARRDAAIDIDAMPS